MRKGRFPGNQYIKGKCWLESFELPPWSLLFVRKLNENRLFFSPEQLFLALLTTKLISFHFRVGLTAVHLWISAVCLTVPYICAKA